MVQQTLFILLFLSLRSIALGQNNVSAENVASDNKKLVSFICQHLFNLGDTTIANQYFVHDFAKEEIAFTETIRSAFPDLIVTIDQMVSEGEYIAVRWTAEGTHLGNFLGVPSTGRKVRWRGSWFWTIRQGKVIDGMGKGTWDGLGLLKQLQAR